MTPVKIMPIEDGIEFVRSTLPRCWFDEKNSKTLVRALENYRQEYDEKRDVYKGKPLHDKYSHMCDSFRYLCTALRHAKKGSSAEELDKRYREAIYGNEHHDLFNNGIKF